MKYNYNIGEVYNLMKINSLFREKKTKRLYAECECIKCGAIKTLRASDLYNQKQNSCRCQIVKHNMHKSKIYSIYHNMKDRCFNQNNHAYHNYGKRGIKVDNEWLGETGFDNFLKWSEENGYQEGLSIDRIDIDGNYSPDNCRWITLGENVALSNVQHPRKKRII